MADIAIFDNFFSALQTVQTDAVATTFLFIYRGSSVDGTAKALCRQPKPSPSGSATCTFVIAMRASAVMD